MLRSILVIRHASTKLNNDNPSIDRIRGWTDHPLSGAGIEQANKLATEIAIEPPDVLLCSDLKRCVVTARIIAQHLGMIPEEPSMDFRPWHTGDLTGCVVAEVMPVLLRYAIETPEIPIPGGESFNRFRKRLFAGLKAALEKHDGLIGIVTHHRTERVLRSWAEAGYPKDGSIDAEEFKRRGAPTGNCGFMNIQVDRLPALKSEYVPVFGDGREEGYLDWVHDQG
jgi:broad specificity phosphatase PhoE